MIDIAVIGAGIQGAGIAQAAAAAGFSVEVFEQYGRLAQGTSSRSSKLIHGGLRYLQTAQFKLVRECLRERALLLDNAPSLVRLVPFYLPIYASSSRGPWLIRAGLSVYALLGGLDQAARFKTVPRSHWQILNGLRTQELRAVFQYYDAQTDDALLTQAVMRSAEGLGARLHTGCEVAAIRLRDDGCELTTQHHGDYQASVVINAAGPWVNRVLDRVTPTTQQRAIDLIQGSHIVIPGDLGEGIYYVESPQDRRAVFVMPWQGNIMVGTTEVSYAGDPAQVQPSEQEIAYLLQTVAHYFPRFAVDPGKIISSFAGLRVLPRGDSPASVRPRETFLQLDRRQRPRLLSVYGGKLTAYRATAEKVIAEVREGLPRRDPIADTRRLKLE